MPEPLPNISKWQKRYEREKKARRDAEKLLEEKSSQLYEANRKLEQKFELESSKLRREEEKFTALFHHSQDGIILQSDDGRVLDANPAICSLLAYDRDQIIGSKVSNIPTTNSLPICRAALVEIKQLGNTRYQCKLLSQNKKEIPVEITATRFKVGKQNIIQGIIRDITENQETAKNLKIATQTAIKANEAKSLFLATMSHEIRTPLNGIIGFTDLLTQSDVSQDQRKHLNLIKKSGDILLNIINDILDFSRIESGQLELEKIDFNLIENIEDTLSIHSQTAKSNGLELRYQIDPTINKFIHGDPGRLKQILLNLVSNGLKFTKQGSVSVEVKKISDHFIQFSVVDTGIGFDEVIKEQLFRPFQQADASTTRKYGGTGLGLAICRQLADAMGGAITASSTVGQGAKFTLTIPYLPSNNQERKSKLPNTFASATGEKKEERYALIVEDNEINAKLAKLLIERAGVTAHIAHNGQEAIEALKLETVYSVIFMDMQMPIMDGIETTIYIRNNPMLRSYNQTPIIAMTANVLPEDEAKCIAAGMNGFITKPIDLQQLQQWLSPH